MPKTNGNGNQSRSRGERLQIMLTPEELAAVDDFRFKQRMPSRAAAVRELFRVGLSSVVGAPAMAGERSADFGVLRNDSGSRRSR
jgi:hypothetical protein